MNKGDKIVIEMLTRMYAEADPPLDFPEFLEGLKQGKDCPDDWYKQHYLSVEQCEEIQSEVEKKYNLREGRLNMDALCYSPTNIKPEEKKESDEE